MGCRSQRPEDGRYPCLTPTDGRLVSPYEDRTLDLADGRRDRFLEIILNEPVDDRGEADPNDPDPSPEAELAQMQLRAEEAERDRDRLLQWQRAVRELVARD
jgi:hypothetical protein